MTNDEAKAFWAAKSPIEVAHLLRAAPRVAGEWERSGRYVTRQVLNPRPGEDRESAYIFAYDAPHAIKWTITNGTHGYCGSLDEAKQAADAALRAAGWVVL